MFSKIIRPESTTLKTPIITAKSGKDNFCMSVSLGRDGWESRDKTGKLSFLEGNQGQLFQFCPGKIEPPFLHIFDSNYPSIYLNVTRNIKNL